MKHLLLAAALFSVQAFAVEIVDERGALQRLAGYASGVKFEEVMACGQTHDFNAQDGSCNYSCNASWCMSTCSPASPSRFKVAVEDCSADQASIYGENGLNLTVTRADFAKGGNTILIPFLNDLSRYMKPAAQRIVLKDIWMKPVAMIEKGRKVSVMGYDLTVELDLGSPQNPQTTITIVPGFKDLRSIARIGSMDSAFYQAKGVIQDEGF